MHDEYDPEGFPLSKKELGKMTMSSLLVMSKCHWNTLHEVLIDFTGMGPTIGKKSGAPV